MKRKPFLIFYLLVAYIFTSFIWWIFYLTRISTEAYMEKKELSHLNYIYQRNTSQNVENTAKTKVIDMEYQSNIKKIDKEYRSKINMIIGEGSVFLIILLVVTFKMNQSLQRENRVHLQQKNFLLSITHELRSPIASSKVALQTLTKRKDLPRDKVDILLCNSINDMDRLHALVENLLLAAKIDGHSFQIRKDACNLSEITNSSIYKINETYEGSRIFEADIKPDIFVVGDRMALTSVITNLVENAVKYSVDASTINVSLCEQGKDVVFKIADNGFGIPDKEKKKIFHKFYRLGQEETRQTKGTGLGLYIVYRILSLHKGKVIVRDNKPKGSIFEVVIPKSI